MKILWDFRLFSTEYRNRGIGIYTQSLANAYLKQYPDTNIYIMGNLDSIPMDLPDNVNLISYKIKDWKNDLFKIPFYISKYKIDIFQYWVALGPLRHIGMGLFHPCKSIGIIHDLGAELWTVPFLKAVRNSKYWKIQKILIRSLDSIISNSKHTADDIKTIFPTLGDKTTTIYKPSLNDVVYPSSQRKKYFITLGGSPHKNVAGVVKAFKLFRFKNPDYTLIVLGKINNTEEGVESVDSNILFEPTMDNYKHHLQNSSGLIFCSFYEGLGLPPLEAMQYNCPLLVSDIPSIRETCSDSAIFVNPYDIEQIADGMMELADNNYFWSKKSEECRIKYQSISSDAAAKLHKIYQDLKP